MTVQLKVIHIYIIVVGAVLYAVDQLHHYIFACEALFKSNTPLGVTRSREYPEDRQTV